MPQNENEATAYVPDWAFMEAYIRAIEKMVIKDVVDVFNDVIKSIGQGENQ